MARPARTGFAPPREPEDEAVPAAVAEPARRGRRRPAAQPIPEWRVGRKHLGAWVNEAAARQFKAMAMEKGKTVQEYFCEMLNREFEREKRPKIAE